MPCVVAAIVGVGVVVGVVVIVVAGVGGKSIVEYIEWSAQEQSPFAFPNRSASPDGLIISLS